MEMEKAFQKAVRRAGAWKGLFFLVLGVLIGFWLAPARKTGAKVASLNIQNNQWQGEDVRQVLEGLNHSGSDGVLEEWQETEI